MDSSEENDELVDNEALADELFHDEDDDARDGSDDNDLNGDANLEEEDKNDAQEEEKKKKSKPSVKRIVKNPRLVLNFERLKSENGISALMELFEKFKFKGKHHEREDLGAIIRNMEHWMCHILYPGYDMETSIKALEKIGRKRVIQTHMKKLRQDSMIRNRDNFDETDVGNIMNVDDSDLNL